MAIRNVVGNGVKQDFEKAFHWFKASAKSLSEAKFNLALAFEAGIGTKQDIEMAVLWYKRAVEDGYVPAYHNLGVIYHFGRDNLPADPTKASSYYEYAASQNCWKRPTKVGQVVVPSWMTEMVRKRCCATLSRIS